MGYVFLQPLLQRDLHRRNNFVESETVFGLHKKVCGVCRLHKHRQKVIAQ